MFLCFLDIFFDIGMIFEESFKSQAILLLFIKQIRLNFNKEIKPDLFIRY